MTDKMVICGLSALDYWRKAAGAEFDASYERLWEGMRVARPCDTVYSRAADLLVALGLPAPLHLLADSPGTAGLLYLRYSTRIVSPLLTTTSSR